eukprot:TRINITY_DN22291_c0_g1_i1.p1 TRINITY_DN22291_c0_g1~~TRINITY_DN22291_c0_g1_i1.p1  ORF type:complete len:109 (-),score=17.17 TRINITY_DN22291_c0_g1_i1:191-472(-)
MATNLAKFARIRANHLLLPVLGKNVKTIITPIRTKVCSETGALLEKPVRVKFGLLKVTCTVTPFLLTGGYLSREFAALLEEHELFVPDDDDDD